MAVCFSYCHNWVGTRETGLAERSSGGTVFNFDISCFIPDFVMPQKIKENRIFFSFFLRSELVWSERREISSL